MQSLFFRLLFLKCATIVVTSSMNVAAFSLELNELTYITENHASFNYVRNGQLEGFAVEVLLSTSADLGSPVQRDEILVQPWARALKTPYEGPIPFYSVQFEPPSEKISFNG